MDTRDVDSPQAREPLMRPVEELEERAYPGEEGGEPRREFDEGVAPRGLVPPVTSAPAIPPTAAARTSDEDGEQHRE
ncbi:MAG TPA: hypothetical protein VF707_16195 [Ardenticatenaceae bacterium]|jgi:hypothetical protein